MIYKISLGSYSRYREAYLLSSMSKEEVIAAYNAAVLSEGATASLQSIIDRLIETGNFQELTPDLEIFAGSYEAKLVTDTDMDMTYMEGVKEL